MSRKPTPRPPGQPSLADVLASLPVMSDEPIDVSPLLTPQTPPLPINEEPPVAFPHAETPYDQQIVKPEATAAPAGDPATEVGTFIRPGEVTRYENRIHMVDAYRFDGRLHAAPDWIDRNWLASADGARIIEPQQIDLDGYFEDLRRDLPLFGERDFALTAVSGTLHADPDRLTQVLRNLVRNAVAHTNADDRVAVTASAAAGRLRIAVADSGCQVHCFAGSLQSTAA